MTGPSPTAQPPAQASVNGGRRARNALIALTALALAAAIGLGGRYAGEPTAVKAAPAPAGGGALAAGRDARRGVAVVLVLVGVAAAGHSSAAIISVAGGPQRLYHIGDRVRDAWVLKSVSSDGAVLAAGDLRQSLALTGGAAAPGVARERHPSAGVHAASGTTAATKIEKRAVAMASWMRLNSNPVAPMQGLLTPDPRGGLRLEGVKPDSPYAKLGLRPGDVLRSLNGTEVESAGQVMVLYNRLKLGRGQKIEVLRDGQATTLRFGER